MTESGCNPLTQARGFTENYALNLDWSKRHSAGGKGWNDQTIANGTTIFLTSRMLRSWNGGAVRSGHSSRPAGWRKARWRSCAPREKGELTLEQIFLRTSVDGDPLARNCLG